VKRKRVLVLVREGLVPPETIEGLSDKEIDTAEWKTEYDVVVTLDELGHSVRVHPVFNDLEALRSEIEEWKPHIVFNLLEEFNGVALYDQNVVSFLELLQMPYTGSNPRGLMIARDKALAKKLLSFHRIRVPDFAVFPAGRRIRRPKRLRFPLFVKSVTEDASLGVSKASLVKDDESLAERVSFVHQQTGADALAEEFIEGRELYVGTIGNQQLEVFPAWELIFDNNPDGEPVIATAAAKWNQNFRKKWGVTSRAARNLPKGLPERIEQHCKRIYRILGLSGYARSDFRLDSEGKLFFLEANPNPALSYGEDFAESAEKKGISYSKLIQRIVNLGLRYKPLRLT
jgi:D-alanine-D-alanine ligase